MDRRLAKWSWTKLSTWMQCPSWWYFQYVAKKKAAVIEPFVRGSKLHRAFEQYAKHCYQRSAEGKRGTDFDHMRAIGKALNDDELAEACEKFAETHEFDDALTVADSDGVERSFKVELPGDAGLFRGKVDHVTWNPIDRELAITDYKTGRMAPADNDEGCPLQLQSYAWAIAEGEDWQPDIIVCTMDYTCAGELRTWEIEPHELSMEWALAVIAEIAAETRKADIEAADAPDGGPRTFEAAPGNHCMYCGYRRHCSAMEAAPPPILDLATAQASGEWLTTTKAQMDEVRKAMKAWVEGQGGIPIGNSMWDWYMSKDKGRRFTTGGKGKAAHDQKKALIARLCKEEGLDQEQAIAVAGRLAPVIDWRKDALAQYVPLSEDDVFAASNVITTDADGNEVQLDLQAEGYLEPVKPTRSFECRPLSDGGMFNVSPVGRRLKVGEGE